MFEWDDDKNASNLLKHGLSFDEARLIFDGPVLSRIDARFEYGEVRIVSIGLIESVLAVAVVHTDRDGKKRIISARLANQKERRLYNEYFE